ncbi:glyoxylate dehydrogenase [Pholiota molesta]|nr:glyoxylate dehydrogenase [Pholiota molesta]
MADDDVWLEGPPVYTTDSEGRRGTHTEVGDDGMELAEEPPMRGSPRRSCDKVYDVTEFLDEHPGGSKIIIILKYAGKDAAVAYERIHPPYAIQNNLPIEKHIGALDPNIVVKVVKKVTEEDKRRQALINCRPPLNEILNLHDFDAVAKAVLPAKAWAYYSSASDDEITIRQHRAAYQRVWFRPRVLHDVTNRGLVDNYPRMRCKFSLPVYISATALGKLGHPDGELTLTRTAGKHDDPDGDLLRPSFMYINRDREITKKYAQHAEKRGVKALFITVDAPQPGRREQDMRMKLVDDGAGAKVQEGPPDVKKDQGVARVISSCIDRSLPWNDIPWFRSITNMHIILKGIVLSNHGGRQLDTSHSGIENLIDIGRGRTPTFAVFVDGGVRRASDVLKVIALGASAVGVGRRFLYAFSVTDGHRRNGSRVARHLMSEEIVWALFCASI